MNCIDTKGENTMALKGLAYPRTLWAYQEKPVASAKLNTWDEHIASAFELVFYYLAHAWGGGDGVLRGFTSNDLQVTPTSPVSLSVRVLPGYAFISKAPYKLSNATTLANLPSPAVFPRIDLVQAVLSTWSVSFKVGVESAAPSAPTADPDCLALAHIFMRPGADRILAADDGTQGYIVDRRVFL
jgi:hypothetical protein